VRDKAVQAVSEALAKLEQETAQGHGKASAGAAAALRAVLKRMAVSSTPSWSARCMRPWWLPASSRAGSAGAPTRCAKTWWPSRGLLRRPEGQALGGRKMQETLRQLREQWKQADQGAPANHALWKKFDDACNAAHKVVESWLERCAPKGPSTARSAWPDRSDHLGAGAGPRRQPTGRP
jgi:hypothetical protein